MRAEGDIWGPSTRIERLHWRELGALGWRVLHFDWEEVTRTPDYVLGTGYRLPTSRSSMCANFARASARRSGKCAGGNSPSYG
jgi:hypothetical protein